MTPHPDSKNSFSTSSIIVSSFLVFFLSEANLNLCSWLKTTTKLVKVLLHFLTCNAIRTNTLGWSVSPMCQKEKKEKKLSLRQEWTFGLFFGKPQQGNHSQNLNAFEQLGDKALLPASHLIRNSETDGSEQKQLLSGLGLLRNLRNSQQVTVFLKQGRITKDLSTMETRWFLWGGCRSTC